jgi:hypothetical protein
MVPSLKIRLSKHEGSRLAITKIQTLAACVLDLNIRLYSNDIQEQLSFANISQEGADLVEKEVTCLALSYRREPSENSAPPPATTAHWFYPSFQVSLLSMITSPRPESIPIDSP